MKHQWPGGHAWCKKQQGPANPALEQPLSEPFESVPADHCPTLTDRKQYAAVYCGLQSKART